MFALLVTSESIISSFVRVRRVHKRTTAVLDRETGPELTWEWTLAFVVCAALAGVFKNR